MNDVIIDWSESTRIAGNNEIAAKEFMHLLVPHLQKALHNIQNAFDQNKITDVKKQIHSLRGALCYCSVPRLKHATSELENALKTNSAQVLTLYNQFKNEIAILIEKIKE